jgi:hypothetical protein
VRHQQTFGKMAKIVVVDVLDIGAVTLAGAMQVAEQLLFLRVDAQHGVAGREGLAAQRIDVAELAIARERIDVAGDELLAQRAASIPGLLQQPRGRVAADFKAAPHQLRGQLHRLEVCPYHVRIGRTAGAVRLQDACAGRAQAGLARACLGPPAAAPTHALRVATWARRRATVARVHCLQLAYACVERASAHAQHPGDIADPATADLQRLDRRIAPPVVLRQRRAVQPHRVFMLGTVACKRAHLVTRSAI